MANHIIFHWESIIGNSFSGSKSFGRSGGQGSAGRKAASETQGLERGAKDERWSVN